MKILIDARLWGLENAGLGRYVINLVNSLTKLDKKNDYTLLLRKQYFQSLNLPANWHKIKAEFRHYSLQEQFLLPLLISKTNPNLVHFPHFNVPLFYNSPFVVTIHDLLMHKFVGEDVTTLPFPLYQLKRYGYSKIFNHAVYGSKKIIVPSLAVKADIQNYYPNVVIDKIICTYEGVDQINSSNPVNNSESKYLLYVGNAYPHKNLDLAIKAAAQMGTVLKIVSARSVFTDRLKDKIAKENLHSVVELLGYVDDKKLETLYQNALAFVFPSLDEGFGLPGLEAMKAGTLLIAADIPVFKEIYKDNAIFFDPRSIQSLVNAVQIVKKMNANERAERLKSGYDLAKTYSWDKMAQETLKIYESCAGLRSG